MTDDDDVLNIPLYKIDTRSPRLTGREVIAAGFHTPQTALIEENLRRFIEQPDAPLVPRPLTEQEALAVLRADVDALRVPDVALYILHREDGSPLPVNGIEGREPEMRTLVQQYYDRGGRLSEAEQATLDLFEARPPSSARQRLADAIDAVLTLPECQGDFLADFCGDPEQGPSLRRLYPDLKIDAFDPATSRRVSRTRYRHRGWYWDTWRGPRNRRRWAR